MTTTPTSRPGNLITSTDLPQPPKKRRRAPTESYERLLVDEWRLRRQTFISEAATLLAGSVDDAEWYLQAVADLAVPTFADWCVIESVRGDGTFRVTAESHVDPTRKGLAAELRRRRPCGTRTPGLVATTARRGRGRLLTSLSEALADQDAIDPDELRIYSALGVRSALVVPVPEVTSRDVEVVLCMFSLHSARVFDNEDLEATEKLACSVTAALQHAHRFSHVDEVIRASTNLVADATSHQLRTPLSALLLQLESLRGKLRRSAPAPDLDALRDGVDRAFDQARRLRDIIEDVLLPRPPPS